MNPVSSKKRERTKIVLVSDNDMVYGYAAGEPWAVGGAERFQWLLARALAKAGWSVTVGVRKTLEAGERARIDGVEFVGIGGGQILSAWSRFLSSERPNWWYWQTASHLWGPAVEIAKLAGVWTIFSTAFDSDVHPRQALSRRVRWWPLYAWGLLRSDKIFVQHEGQLSGLRPGLRSKAAILPSVVERVKTPRPHAERAKYVAWVGC